MRQEWRQYDDGGRGNRSWRWRRIRVDGVSKLARRSVPHRTPTRRRAVASSSTLSKFHKFVLIARSRYSTHAPSHLPSHASTYCTHSRTANRITREDRTQRLDKEKKTVELYNTRAHGGRLPKRARKNDGDDATSPGAEHTLAHPPRRDPLAQPLVLLRRRLL